MEVSGQFRAPVTLLPGKDIGTHWVEGWLGPKTGLDAVMKRTSSMSLPGDESRH
jgi:hypothetical protein